MGPAHPFFLQSLGLIRRSYVLIIANFVVQI